jgi:subtilase family serine protease
MRVILVVLLACAVAGCSGGGTSSTPLLPSSGNLVNARMMAMAMPGGNSEAICTALLSPGYAKCPVLLNLSVGYLGNLLGPLVIPGLHPADLQSAYALLSASAGKGSTVAVVAKGDDPNAEHDLGVYRKMFRLPACTTQNGCFRKVNESGVTSSFPAGDSEWSQEIAVDLDMVSAICPNCHIMLVEANTASIDDLGTAVDTAARLGATEISNSYFAPEYEGAASEAQHYNHPGIAITVSSGDGGYGTTFPADLPYVTAVGGTTLSRSSATSRGWKESVWTGTGSGCSAYFAKPSWQKDTGCAMRTSVDTAVVADPNTGVAAYNTYAPLLQQGWAVYGGTSIGAPVVAAIYALAGNAVSLQGAGYAYTHPSAFNAILTGSNGTCSPLYLCTAVAGYNGPAGMGTPKGTAGF